MVLAQGDRMVSKPGFRHGAIVLFTLVLSWVGGAQARAQGSAQAVPVAGGDASVPDQPAPPRFEGDAVALPSSSQSSQAPAVQARTWYGYQIMLADAASIGLGLAVNSPEVVIVGYLGAPLVLHGIHGRLGWAIASLMMRGILPILGIAIGTQFRNCNANGDECALGGAIVGGSIGTLTAMLLDWSLAWGKAASPSPVAGPGELKDDQRARPGRSAGLVLTTAGLAARSNGLSLVLGGTF
jgi:hypothetical protein